MDFITTEADAASTTTENLFSDLFQLVLEYNERAMGISGIVGGNEKFAAAPLILRRNCISGSSDLFLIDLFNPGASGKIDPRGLHFAHKNVQIDFLCKNSKLDQIAPVFLQ